MALPPPPPLYKFLNSEHLDFVFGQKTLKISSSAYFRRQYEAMPVKNDFINDPHEGHAFWHQAEPFVLESATELEREAAKIMFSMMPLPASANATFSNNSIVSFIPSFHMISFAEGPIEEAAAALCAPMQGIPKPYDACLEILDIDALMADLLNLGTVSNPQGGVTRFHELFHQVCVNQVRYQDIEANFDSEQPIADPFLKDRSFAAQREVRGVFERIAGSQVEDTLIVHVETLDKHMKPVDIPPAKGFEIYV